jgi:Ca-activated chloride channel family protein
VGVGSAAGAILDIEGFRVHTRLDEPMLRAIADRTGGTYHHASSADELHAIYETLDTRLVVEAETTEVTSLVAALGLALLTVGAAAALVWLGRLP